MSSPSGQDRARGAAASEVPRVSGAEGAPARGAAPSADREEHVEDAGGPGDKESGEPIAAARKPPSSALLPQAIGLPPGDRTPASKTARRWLLAILLLALALRAFDLVDPFSGAAFDFRSQFGGFATGGPARNFAQHGLSETLGMPYYWRVPLADGSVDFGWYAHHPALFAVLSSLPVMVFGRAEWALRLPWLVFNLISIVALFRLARILWGERAALWASFWFAVLPLSVFCGTMVWTDTLVVLLHLLLLRQYLCWMETDEIRPLAWACLWSFLGGMTEWTHQYLMPSLALHALIFCLRRGGWRKLVRATAIPLAGIAAIGLHALHMRLVLPEEHISADSSGTLSWATSLHEPLFTWLGHQGDYLVRYLTWPALILCALAFARQVTLALRGRLGARDALLFAMAFPGPIYVGLFPARSTNHDFFLFLSMPWFALAVVQEMGALQRLLAGLVARRIQYAPILARAVPALLALVILGASLNQNFQLWAMRKSNRLVRLAKTEWLAPVLDDEDALLFLVTLQYQPLHFYARAAVHHEMHDLDTLLAYRERVLAKRPAGAETYLLIDPIIATQLELARAARTEADAAGSEGGAGRDGLDGLVALYSFLEESGTGQTLLLPPGGPRDRPVPFRFYDLSDWARSELPEEPVR